MPQPEPIKQLLAFDKRELRWLIATRCTIGLGLCLAAYSLAGHTTWGILASLGSLYAAFASYTGIFQSRMRHMLATSVVISIQAIVGTLVGGNNLEALACVTLVGFLFSLYAALRPAASLLATLAMACTVIFAKVLPVTQDATRAAIGNGLIVLSGGASQAFALALFWPLTRFHPDRRAVAEVYESLAGFARILADTDHPVMLNSRAIQDAHETLDPLERYRMWPEQVALKRALSAAEGIRAALVALSGAPEQDREPLQTWLRPLADRLERAASDIFSGRILHAASSAPPLLPENLEPTSATMVRVIEQLLARLSAPAEVTPPSESQTDWRSHVSFRIIALESSPSLRAIALRHALRVAVALFASTCLARFGSFPNGYWIPLTTCLVLRTDYATTLSRGFARAVGAILGVLISIAIAGPAHQIPWAHTAIFLAAGFGFFAVYRASYTVYSTMITVWVISSLAAAGIPERLAGWYRLEDTVIGAAIAFFAYRLIPTWQSGRVAEVLRDAATAQVNFCERVLLQPTLPPRSAWERELDATRAIRYEAETVISAAAKEPAWERRRPELNIEQKLLKLERNAARILGVVARRLASPELTPDAAAEAESAISQARAMITTLTTNH